MVICRSTYPISPTDPIYLHRNTRRWIINNPRMGIICHLHKFTLNGSTVNSMEKKGSSVYDKMKHKPFASWKENAHINNTFLKKSLKIYCFRTESTELRENFKKSSLEMQTVSYLFSFVLVSRDRPFRPNRIAWS
jgi:hypothetical protein